jgi:small conductance mechanosensitive channel
VTMMISNVGTFGEQLSAWAASALPNLIAAILILVVGWWLAGRVEQAIIKLLGHRKEVDRTLSTVLSKVCRYIVLVLVLVIALSQLGIQTTTILAALGAIGLAIGLALQSTLSNIAAGIMLLWLRPFSLGQFIECNGDSGTVDDVGLFATTLVTFDGIYVFVPNSQLWNNKIVNYSKKPKRMVREIFTISYDDDIQKARQILLDLVRSDDRVDATPEPIVKVKELGDSAVALDLRAWTNTSDFWPTRWDIVESGKVALEAGGLSIPYPQQDVHIRNYDASGDGTGNLIPAASPSGNA